jgi:hypothetical protein
MLDGLARYKTHMVTHDDGLDWNSSLFGVLEQAAVLLPDSLRPASPAALLQAGGQLFLVTMGVCAMIGLAGVWAFVTGRLRPLEAVFLLLAVNMLGTPFYGQYHMLVYAAALLLLPMEWKEGRLPLPAVTLVVTCALFAMAALVRSALPLDLWPFLLLAMTPVALWAVVLPRLPSGDREAGIIFVGAFWGMCSLGGRFAQGPVQAVSILIASCLILHQVLRRPVGKAVLA